MDIIKTVKDLIKKAKNLNDIELLQLANELLEKYSDSESKIKVNFTKDDIPNVDIGLKPPILDSQISYQCTNCDHTFRSKNTRKKCPNCKKSTLQISKKKAKRGTKKTTHAVPIDTTKTKYNRFVDNGTLCNDKENEYLKTKSITPRSKPQYKPKLVTCDRCNKTYEISPICQGYETYVCDNCLVKGTRT